MSLESHHGLARTSPYSAEIPSISRRRVTCEFVTGTVVLHRQQILSLTFNNDSPSTLINNFSLMKLVLLAAYYPLAPCYIHILNRDGLKLEHIEVQKHVYHNTVLPSTLHNFILANEISFSRTGAPI